MRVYVDSSAVTKLIVPEKESTALKRYLRDFDSQPDLMSSVLLETEVRRAAMRESIEQIHVTQALNAINLAPADNHLFMAAGLLPGPGLRSLDALHLATALENGADLMIAYDHRLLQTARSFGIPTASPT